MMEVTNESRIPSGLVVRGDEDSPFGRFFGQLQRLTGSPTDILVENARWTAIPYAEAALFGIWSLLSALGDRLGQPIRTETHAWEDMAPRLDRVLGFGLLAKFTTPELAARTFCDEVSAHVDASLRRAPSGTLFQPHQLWSEPATDFFVAIARHVKEARERLERLMALLAQENEVPSVGSFAYISGELHIDAEQAIKFLDPANALKAEGFTKERMPSVGHILSIQDRMVDARQRFDALRRLPVRPKRIPREALFGTGVTRPSVENQWVRTQLLLCFGDDPEAECIDSETYRVLVRAMRAEPSDAVWTETFWQRMASRDPKAPQLRARLAATIAEGIKWLRTFAEETLSASYVHQIFILLDADRSGITADNAFEVAVLTSEELARHFPPEDHARIFGEELPGLLNWGELNRLDLGAIFDAGRIPTWVIAAYVPKMAEDVKPYAIQHLLNQFNASKRVLTILIDNKSVPFTPTTMQKYRRYLTRPKVKKALRKLLADMARHDRVPAELHDWSNFGELTESLAGRLSAEEQEEFFSDPKLREATYITLQDAWHMQMSGPSWSEQSPKAVGRWSVDLRTRFALAMEVRFRIGVYDGSDERLDPKGAKDLRDGCLPAWEDLAERWESDQVIVWGHLPDILGLSVEETRQVIARFPEDEILAWIFPFDPDLKANVAAYQAHRKAYYARKRKAKLFPLPRPT